MRLPAYELHRAERLNQQALVRALWRNAFAWCAAIAACGALALFV